MRGPDTPGQRDWWAIVPMLAGLHGLRLSEGFFSALVAGVPGILVLSCGTILFLMPGDRRIKAYLGLGSAVGAVLAIPLVFAADLGGALLAVLLFGASFALAGRLGLRDEPTAEGAPVADDDWEMQVKAGIDQAVMGYFSVAAKIPSGEEAARMGDEAQQMRQIIQARGWDRNPAQFHARPAAPERVNVRRAQRYGHDYERICFDSQYQANDSLPGAGRWALHTPNQRAIAWVLRHPGPPRPWLVCIHGYRMGEPWMDFSLFPPQHLHQRLGLNLLMPVLPLHGPRRVGRKSGDGYLDGDLLELIFAQSQALWDLRRWVQWLRTEQAEAGIGAYGISLGGYNAALLSAYEAFDFVVAGIPVSDLSAPLWGVLPSQHQQYYASRDLDQATFSEILQPVSPLAVEPKVAPDRRHIFAATGDLILSSSHPLALGRHWQCAVDWYQGSHLSVRTQSMPLQILRRAMGAANWKVFEPI